MTRKIVWRDLVALSARSCHFEPPLAGNPSKDKQLVRLSPQRTKFITNQDRIEIAIPS